LGWPRPAHPISLGGTEFEPRDIFSWDGATGFAMILDGSVVGIPADTRIDALFLGSAGQLVLSFDVPTRLGGVEYRRSDLVAYASGVFSLYWSAASAGVPSASNLVGAALDFAGVLAVTFDVPTSLSGSEYLPGELAGWSGMSWYHYDTPGGWPASAQLRDFAFVPAPGSVPDGGSLPGIPLTVTPAAAGDITTKKFIPPLRAIAISWWYRGTRFAKAPTARPAPECLALREAVPAWSGTRPLAPEFWRARNRLISKERVCASFDHRSRSTPHALGTPRGATGSACVKPSFAFKAP
jgi:hypothetical protein